MHRWCAGGAAVARRLGLGDLGPWCGAVEGATRRVLRRSGVAVVGCCGAGYAWRGWECVWPLHIPEGSVE